MAKPNNTALTRIAAYRVRIPAGLVEQLDNLVDPVRIDYGTRCQRFTFRGVPGRLVDFLVDDWLLRDDMPPTEAVLEVSDQRPHRLAPAIAEAVLEIGERAGKYDSTIRRRYCLRSGPLSPDHTVQMGLDNYSPADLRIFRDAQEVTVIVAPRDAPAIIDGWQTLRSDLSDYDLPRIVLWHWHKWYRHLAHAEAEAAAQQWAAEAHALGQLDSWTLAEANRSAARFLYRLSRDLGWRKLTLDEKERLGLPPDSPQWRHQDEIAAKLSRTGAGEASLTAARFGRWEINNDDAAVVHALDARHDGGLNSALDADEVLK